VDQRALPLQVRFLAGESTGSYLTRLAARNGLRAGQLLDSVGEGLSFGEVDPRFTELYLNRAARVRLAALTGREVEVLVRALPSLQDAYLLSDADASSRPVWKWPWTPHGGYLVRGCALCAATRGIEQAVWLMRPDPWHLCLRHRRFTDSSRDDARAFLDLSKGPAVLEAERRQRLLLRRMGPAGRVMVADAYAVLARSMLRLPQLGHQRTAVLWRLPHATELAWQMAGWERARLAGRTRPAGAHRQRLRHTLRPHGFDAGEALTQWIGQHTGRTAPTRAPARRRWPGVHTPHTPPDPLQSIDEISCLPWSCVGYTERPWG
jgi:hypothetical protein